MNKNNIISVLKEKPMEFTLSEIQEIMEYELSKEPEKMNTELIDLCADTIENGLNQQNGKHSKKIQLNKFILCAAIVIIIVSIAIPVTANYFSGSSILQEVEDGYEINLNNGDDSTVNHCSNAHKIIRQFEEYDFKNIVLPSALLNTDHFSYFTVDPNDTAIFARADFNYDEEIFCSIIMLRGYEESDAEDFATTKSTEKYKQKKILNQNGMDILVYSYKTDSMIMYKDRDTVYHIHLQYCSFDEALKIAETI